MSFHPHAAWYMHAGSPQALSLSWHNHPPMEKGEVSASLPSIAPNSSTWLGSGWEAALLMRTAQAHWMGVACPLYPPKQHRPPAWWSSLLSASPHLAVPPSHPPNIHSSVSLGLQAPSRASGSLYKCRIENLNTGLMSAGPRRCQLTWGLQQRW